MSSEADRIALGAELEAVVERVVRRVLAERATQPGARVEGFIGTREAARRWGVGQDTVLEAIKSSRLPATRPPGCRDWRIRPSDLESFLAGESTGPTPVDLQAKRAERAARIASALTDGGKGKGGRAE